MGVEKEWGSVPPVRMGAEIYTGMTGPLRTGVETYDMIGKVRGSRERIGFSSAGAHRNQEIQGYVCPAAGGSREIRHLLLAKCVGVDND